MGKAEKLRHSRAERYPYVQRRYPASQRHIHILRPASHRHSQFFVGLFMEQQPVHHTVVAWKPPPELKRLQFVGNASEHYSAVLAELYSGSRKHLPKTLLPSVAALEARVASVGSPFLDAVQRQSRRVLVDVDRKVDGACLAASQWLWPSAPWAAWQQRGPLQLKTDADLERTYPWDSLAHAPAVSKLVERYEDVHSALVASPSYHRAVHGVNGAVTHFQQSSVYRLAARNLWWTVSPVADPTLDYLAHSQALSAIMQHLTPVEQPELQPTH